MIPPRYLALPLVAASLLALAGCGGSSQSATPSKPGSVAAIVNGHPIPMSDYQLFYRVNQRSAAGQPGVTKAALVQRSMNDVILDELVRQYAAAHGIRVTNAEVDSRVKSEVAQAGGKAAFNSRLQQYGLTLSGYQKLLKPNLLIQKVMAKVVPVRAGKVEVAHVRHILIATKPTGKQPRTDAEARALAQQVLAQVKAGKSFAALAKRYSDDPGSAAQGGDLGNVYPGQTVPPFDHASFHQPIGQYRIVHSVYGYHILEVLSRSKAPLPPQQQQMRQQQAFGRWLNRQMAAAKIKRIVKATA